MVQYFFLYSFNLVKFSNHMSIFLQVFAFNYSFCIKNINIFHFLYFQVIIIIISTYNKTGHRIKKIVFQCNDLCSLFFLTLVYKVKIIGKFRQRIDQDRRLLLGKLAFDLRDHLVMKLFMMQISCLSFCIYR